MRYQSDLCAYRDEMKGLAILMVAFFHARLGLGGVLGAIQGFGYGGVDIFFLLTGFGLYRSLSKPDGLNGYIKRRALRLFPAYVPFCLCWLAVMLPRFSLGLAQRVRVAAGNLFMFGFFADVPEMISWYVSALALVICLAPAIYLSIRSAERPFIAVSMLLVFAFAAGLCFIGDERYMAVSRLPIFIIGMAAAMPVWKSGKTTIKAIAGWSAFIIGLVIAWLCQSRYPGLLNDYAMYWHPFILIVPPLTMGIGWFFRKTEKLKVIFAPLRLCGRASFEIFLFNCWAEVLGKRFGWANGPLGWALLTLGSLAAGLIYHLLVTKCVSMIQSKRKTSLHVQG